MVLLVHVVFVYMPLLSKMDLLSKMKLHYLMVLLVLATDAATSPTTNLILVLVLILI